MQVYKYIHSCLVVEEGKDKILFDPGVFSFIEGKVRPETFSDVSTIIITHQHPDHVDMAMLKEIVTKSGATVLTNSEGKTAFAKEGIAATILEEGNYQTKNFTIRALPAAHEKILSATLPQNTAYIINDTFLNPGDSFDALLTPLKGIKALAVPSMAPWTTEVAIAQFTETMKPRLVIPVHDGYAKDFFLKQRYENYTKAFAAFGVKFQPMGQPGDVVSVQ